MAINGSIARLCTTADQSAWMTPAGLAVWSLVFVLNFPAWDVLPDGSVAIWISILSFKTFNESS